MASIFRDYLAATEPFVRTDLARRTRHIVYRVRRGDTVLVESYGEEQIVLVDILDYRIMRAVAAYHALMIEMLAATRAAWEWRSRVRWAC